MKIIRTRRRDYWNRKYAALIKFNGGSIGKGVKFGESVTLSSFGNIDIGNNVHIGSNSFIRANGGLIIGDNVIISRNVVIYTCSHEYEGKLLPFDEALRLSRVVIGDNTWIGMGVTIAPGTSIGEGSIIGLGASVYGNIPPLTIVGSGGFTIMKERDGEKYFCLKEKGAFCKEDGKKL